MTTPAPQPSSWIRRFTHLIPAGTQVLDVACGSGRHMRWLAQQGYQPLGVDRNPDSLQLAAQWGDTVQADLEDGSPWPLPDRQFGGVVVTNYLWRPLLPVVVDSVAPGGVLIYETFALGNETVGRPARAEFLLAPGELLHVCKELRVVGYEDGFIDEPARFVQRITAVRELPQAGGPSRHLLSIGAS